MNQSAIKSPLVALLFVAVVGYVATGQVDTAATPLEPPTISVEVLSPLKNGRTNKAPTFKIAVENAGDTAKKVRLRVVGAEENFVVRDITNKEHQEIPDAKLKSEFQTSGEVTVEAILLDADGGAVPGVESQQLTVMVDTTGPTLGPVTTRWTEPDGNLIVRAEFDEDLKPQGDEITVTDHFDVLGEVQVGVFKGQIPDLGNRKMTIIGKVAELNLARLPQANYQLQVAVSLQDDLGNAPSAVQSKAFTVLPPPATVAPIVSIVEDLPETRDGIQFSNSTTVTLKVEGVPTRPGQLRYFVNSRKQFDFSTDKIGRPITQQVKLTNQGINTISVSVTDAKTGNTLTSTSTSIALDDVGPLLQHVELVESPTTTGTEPTLLATFATDDFATDDSGLVNQSSFEVRQKGSDTPVPEKFRPTSAVVEGRTIRLSDFKTPLPAGAYQLEVKSSLQDKAGNPAGKQGATDPRGKPQTSSFSVMGERTFGQHVEFTPYAPPKKQVIPAEGFNPGDFVETRVARLYYYRDAHRVAQIINRNIRSYNQAAVTQAERRAERSRTEADDATDERREKERAAVRAAEQARNAEQQLAQAQQSLAEAQRLKTQIALDNTERTRLSPQPASEEPAEATPPPTAQQQRQIAELDEQITKNTASLNYLGTPEQLAGKVASMQQSVANLRETELGKREAWNGAQAIEARRRATQFRDEVTAAETDPDTYVAGDIHSVDPVTQVSISVIGEGLIQLRGPIKGINKIRTMINQIDSPVGQIKIGVFTVQVNGEEGDKMEKVVGNAEGYIDLSRFLVNQSLNLLRRAIQSEAAMIAEQCEHDGHYQVDRDRRYLYAFFGRDFIDELYELNSEFLSTENKLLSLHAMDTVSFNRAMFILALAKNDVRERIVTRFLESAKTELPDAEFDFRRSSELRPHRSQKHFPHWNRARLSIKNHYHLEREIHEAVHRNALQRYHFRNFSSYFDTGFVHADTMNPMQREFIRLAQIFKARLVAEMEWKQRVMERGLIEDRSNDEDEIYRVLSGVRETAYVQLRDAYEGVLEAKAKLASVDSTFNNIQADLRNIDDIEELFAPYVINQDMKAVATALNTNFKGLTDPAKLQAALDKFYQNHLIKNFEERLSRLEGARWLSSAEQSFISQARQDFGDKRKRNAFPPLSKISPIYETLVARKNAWEAVAAAFWTFRSDIRRPDATVAQLDASYDSLRTALKNVQNTDSGLRIHDLTAQLYQDKQRVVTAEDTVEFVKEFLKDTRAPLDHRKLLNHLIDQQEEKFIELVEGTRSHIAVMDQYLKRLSIALEDDFKTQFYDPAFVRVRESARGRSVNLSQVERTTILTNNRDFAKVDPQATMEFDLPKRQIAIKEAFDAAKALVEDTGALINDPTFLSAFQMMGGDTQPATVKNLVPAQSMSTDQHIMGLVPPPPPEATAGSSLQSLVPEPSVYKLETGTGFQLRPVMQPDGDSAVYDFDYMYTTNIREPVRADEKHVGRIKRQFVHTSVQTGNFELREISRYQVALKVSRTSKGVPLLEDIPILGIAFRPAPSDESSLQQNIIFGQTNIYPTLFDLMGLRWAQQVVDLDHASLLDTEHVIRGRQKTMRDFVFGEASKRVDEFLDVPSKAPRNYRPDFYHPQTLPSPHHPRGYSMPSPAIDPTGNDYERFDSRPPEMQDPPYDRYRHRPVHPESIGPQAIPEQIPLQSVLETVPIDPPNRDYGRAQESQSGDFGSRFMHRHSETLKSTQDSALFTNSAESSTHPYFRRN